MSTVPIPCPQCRGAAVSTPDAQGIHTCVYCSARYRVDGEAPPVATLVAPGTGRPPEIPTPRSYYVIGGMFAALLVGSLAVLSTMSRPADEQIVMGLGHPAPSPNAASPNAAAPNAPTSAGAPNAPVDVPVPAAAPIPATFTFASREPASDRSFWVNGTLENTSAVPVQGAKVTAVLLDKTGARVQTFIGNADPDTLPPGGRAPIKLLVQDPAPFETIRYEATATPIRATPPPG